VKHKDVVGLIKSKNKCLRRFLEISLAFQESAQKADFSGLDSFQVGRESCLKTIDLYDRKITQTVATLSDLDRTTDLSIQVELYLREKNELVALILDTDEVLMELIEGEKNRIQREVLQNQKSKEAIGKFKSTWVTPSGDGLDENL